MASNFPEVQGGGSLLVAWQIRGRRVLVVGGGEVAAGRILHCLNADAAVTVVAPASGLNPEVAYRVGQKQVQHIDHLFEPADLYGADMVLAAVDDPEVSTRIWKMCKEKRVPVNVADVPSECDFYFGSVHRDGPLQIMVSTNGRGPRLAHAIRRYIAKILPKQAGKAINSVGELRVKLRRTAPGPIEAPRRMAWMTKVSDAYSFEELCSLTDEDVDNLLRFYAANVVPPLDILLSMRGNPDLSKIDVFDGSFGFSSYSALQVYTVTRNLPMARLRQNAPRYPLSPGLSEQGHLTINPNHRPQCDILDTTFSLYRVSPLYVGPHGLSAAQLDLIGRQLRGALVGDIVRGVEIGLDDSSDRPLANAGILQQVALEWVAVDALLGASMLALQVAIRYENAFCHAFLLPHWQAKTDNDAGFEDAAGQPFLHLPLLLMRMPTPLKAIIIEFLSAVFDCRISPLRLGGKDLIHSWEAWAQDTGLRTASPLAKDAVFTLGFCLPGISQFRSPTTANVTLDDVAVSPQPLLLGLKTVEIIVPSDELRRFLGAGGRHGLDTRNISNTPFTSALAQYIEHHLALDILNPAVNIVRIACEGFVLSENRIKIFGFDSDSPGVHRLQHQAAIRHMLGDLVTRAELTN